MLSKVVSSSIFKVFGMTRPGIEPRSPGPLANTLTAGPMSQSFTIFDKREVQFSSFGFFYRSHEEDDPCWIVVYLARLVLSKSLLDGFTHMALSTTLKFTVSKPHNFARSSSLLRPQRHFLNYLASILSSATPSSLQNFFGCFRDVMVQFKRFNP